MTDAGGTRAPANTDGSLPARGESAGASRAIQTRVLVVDDEAELRRSLVRLLGARGFAARAVEDGDEAVKLAAAGECDVMLVDLRMPGTSGMDVLEQVKRARPDVEVLMMTAYADVDTAVAAVKAGAYDFLTKPFPTGDAIAISIAKAAEHQRLVGRTRELEQALEVHERFGDIIGLSAKMRDVYRLVAGVAASTSTVLILGESGTGKELVARAIHQRSTRADKPLVVVNCGAIPPDLVESELFGHLKGAFTGATATRQGLFETADHGTIFLDEVGDLPLPAQVKLLRTLQEGEVRRVGSNEARTVDVRVIAATNVDLRARVRDGKFREDLYYRLNVISLVLPSLRERREDIPLLAAHFVRKYARRMAKDVTKISPEAMRELESRPWPGNVRELENAIERAVVLARTDSISADDLPGREGDEGTPAGGDGAGAGVGGGVGMGAGGVGAGTGMGTGTGTGGRAMGELPYTEARRRALEEFERAYVTSLLGRTGGNISQAARAAGLDRSNFKRVLRRVSGTREAGDGDNEGDEG